eukprot:TRINITY_DN7885_c0_g2_i1.p1 TRINITY_DN7885_c0_g2~~TRINITY_DN7885_c0_g2_i1.p1  ORF type:complete len:365 (+),score=38.43 TRINITY_DN7885_c0_g2_i1:165-1259(+)
MSYSFNQQGAASGYATPTPPGALRSIFARQETPDAMAGFHFDAGVLASCLKHELESLKNNDEANMALPGTPRGTFRDFWPPLVANKASADFLSPKLSHEEVPFDFLAPPPKPHSVARPSRKTQGASVGVANLQQRGLVISLGTVGHPVNCAEACEYAMRKGGSPDGADCLKCHACEAEDVAEGTVCTESLQRDTLCDSVGTLGHPYSCSEPFEHAHRQAGCRNGTMCPKCHKSQWQRRPRKLATPSAEEAQLGDSSESKDAPTAPHFGFMAYDPEPPRCILSTQPHFMVVPMLHPPPGLELEANPPLLGSIGHPQTCGAACKFAHKPKGCKDGTLCSHCHLCHWTRKGTKGDHVRDFTDSSRSF